MVEATVDMVVVVEAVEVRGSATILKRSLENAS
jgi:hypothetical protein